MTTYTHQNCQQGTVIYDVDKQERIHCVSQINTNTNALTVHESPFIIDGDSIRPIERKFQRIEVLPSTEFPNRSTVTEKLCNVYN